MYSKKLCVKVDMLNLTLYIGELGGEYIYSKGARFPCELFHCGQKFHPGRGSVPQHFQRVGGCSGYTLDYLVLWGKNHREGPGR